MSEAQFERLIATLRGGSGGGAAGAAAVVGQMGPCMLGKDKLKRPKKWTDWHKDAENKMRFLGQKMPSATFFTLAETKILVLLSVLLGEIWCVPYVGFF